MEVRNLPDALKLIKRRHGWSQTDLARELRLSQTWVSKVISGSRDPGITRVANHLARVGWKVTITPIGEESDPVQRREFNTKIAGAAGAIFIPSPKTNPYQNPDYLRKLTMRVARQRYEIGGGGCGAIAIQYARKMEALLPVRDRRLQLAAADLACEAVWTLHDSFHARRYQLGEYFGRVALGLAQRAGDSNAQSRALSVLSMINERAGNGDRAVAYAKTALRLPDLPEEQRAWLRLRLAWGLGAIPGHEPLARETLGELTDYAADPGRMPSFERADLTGGIGWAFRKTRAYQDAGELLGTAASTLHDVSPLLAAVFLGQHAITALEDADPALAADRMTELAHLIPLVSSARVTTDATTILTLARQWSTVPELREATTHLRSVLPTH